MADFLFKELELPDAYLISHFYAGDSRGSFAKIYEKDIFLQAGINFNLNESFVSKSAKNVVRGMHFQLKNPQAKIVSVLSGRAWDCIVDLRKNSSTYKKWLGVELTADNHKALYVPRGFAHGFAALEDGTMMLYHCDGEYDRETDTGVLADDDELDIKWPVDLSTAIRSEKDLRLLSLKEYESLIE